MKLAFVAIAFFPFLLFSQTAVGPNSPAFGANVAGIGTYAWTTPGNIVSSDNTYATVAQAQGSSNYLQGTNFGFLLLNTDVVTGIAMGVEKSVSATDVTPIGGGWTVGVVRGAAPAGINRCLIVVIGLENETQRQATNVFYGNKLMTPAASIGLSQPFHAQIGVWYLLETDIATAVGTTITYSYTGDPPLQNFEIVGSGMYANVDQVSPLFSSQTASIGAGMPVAHTFTPNWPIGPGSLSIYSVFCGAPVGTTAGPVNSFTINNGYTERLDQLNFNSSWTTSGGTMMVADKQHANVAAGTETATTATFQGSSPNRRTIAVINLRRARTFDNNVRLLKSGTLTGTTIPDAAEWSTVDAYTTYGGTNNMWGTTWDYTEINNPGFGGSFSATLNNNGAARVDHMIITVYKTSILPVELVSFTSSLAGKSVALNWVTASEKNVDQFVVERSLDGVNFEVVGTRKSDGDSELARSYELLDERPATGTNYYRLKTVDSDGTVDYSQLVAEVFAAEPSFSVYPNPASGWAKVLADTGIDELLIVDAEGKTLQRLPGNGKNNSEDIDLSGCEDGVYYICIKTKGGTTIKQLVKISRSAGELH